MTNGELISLLRDLSTEEKVAQLCQVDMKEFADGAASATGPITGRGERFTRAVGSVICGANADPEVFARVQERIRAQSPHGIPALFMSDVIHGWRTIFPIPLALGCTFDPELVRRTARVSALECAASGIHCTFAPMADVARTRAGAVAWRVLANRRAFAPRWPRPRYEGFKTHRLRRRAQ